MTSRLVSRISPHSETVGMLLADKGSSSLSAERAGPWVCPGGACRRRETMSGVGVGIPRPFGPPFHCHPANDSTLILPPIPSTSGHPFWLEATQDFVRLRSAPIFRTEGLVWSAYQCARYASCYGSNSNRAYRHDASPRVCRWPAALSASTNAALSTPVFPGHQVTRDTHI